MKKVFKIILGIIVGIVAFFIASLLILNGLSFVVYRDYYDVKVDLAINEGLGDGYVPQGVSKVEYDNETYYLTSGYMTGNRPSRIYVISEDDFYYVEVKLNDYDYAYGHFGGIATTDTHVFVSDANQLYILSLKDIFAAKTIKNNHLLASKEKNEVKILKSIYVDVAASYVYIDNNNEYLYVGEFNDNKNYFTYHEELVNSGSESYYAYVDRYSVAELLTTNMNHLTSDFHFAVRNKVQGFAISDDKIVLSTSYGLASSVFFVYDIPTEPDRENVYFLDDRYLIEEIKAPAMTEALDYDGEYFITLFESASNKYIFGKFFFTNKIVGLKI